MAEIPSLGRILHRTIGRLRAVGGGADAAPQDVVTTGTESVVPSLPQRGARIEEQCRQVVGLDERLKGDIHYQERKQETFREMRALQEKAVSPFVSVLIDNIIRIRCICHGTSESAVDSLKTVAAQMRGFSQSSGTHFSPNGYVTSALQALPRLVGRGQVPRETLALVCHLARILALRADQQLAPQVRNQEPAEVDREWFGQCVGMVERWVQGGQARVEGGSNVNLASLLASEPVCVVGSTIRLSAPPPRVHDAAATTYLDAVRAAADKGFGDATETFLAACEHNPPAIDALFGALDPRFAPNQDWVIPPLKVELKAAIPVLQAAERHAWLRPMLAPHAERLAHFVSECEARGTLSAHNSSVVPMLGALTAAFPHLVDARFMQQEVAPLVVSRFGCQDAARLAWSLWDRQASLVEPTVTALTWKPALDVHGHVDAWKLLAEAVEHRGWQPTREQAEWMLGHTYVPPRSDESVLLALYASNGGLGSACRVACELLQRYPDLRTQLQVPLPGGGLGSISQSLGMRLRQDAAKNLMQLWPMGSDDKKYLQHLHGLASMEPGTSERLLKVAEKESIDALSDEGKLAWMTLPWAVLTPEQSARWERLWQPQLDKSHRASEACAFINYFRRREIDQSLARMASASTPAECFDDTAALLKLATFGGMGRDATHGPTAILERFSKAVAALPADALQAQVAVECGRLESGIAQPTALADDSRVRLAMLGRLSTPGLRERLRDIADAYLTSPHGWEGGDIAPSKVLEPYRQEAVSTAVDSLRSLPLTRAERVGVLGEVLAIRKAALDKFGVEDKTIYEQTRLGLIEHDGLPPELEDAETVCRMYQADDGPATTAEKGARLLALLDVLGPHRDGRVVELYMDIESRVRAGQDREEAMEDVVATFVLGRPPQRKPPDGQVVSRQEGGLKIAGLAVPVRS